MNPVTTLLTMPLLFFLIALLIIFTYLLLTHSKSAKTRLPPGPPRLPLIGNLHQFRSAGNLPFYLWKLSTEYGPIIHLKLGLVQVVVVSSPKLAKEVLKTQDLAFCSRPQFLGMKKLSYNCTDVVFAPYGDYWREMRKITTTHFFSLKKTQSFRGIREEEVYRVITKISRVSGAVNLSEMAMALGSSLICRIAFGKRFEEHGSEMRRFDELLHDAQAALATFFVSDYFPCLSWLDKVFGCRNWLDTTFNNLDSFYQELIDERLNPVRAEEEEEEEKEKDILDIFIQLIKEEKSCSIDLKWDHIKALIMNIFVAATDTSAATTVWTMMALMKAPNVIVKKLQQEIRNLVGRKGKVDEDDLPQLPYLKAVINETLRLYPPAPLLVPRETLQKCSLEGYEIQPKTMVYVNAWAVARDPEYWENPDEFVPERFLNGDIDIKGQDFGMIPFGSGRRICPGMLMGLANVELTVANLLYSFDWELPRGIRAEDIDTDVLPGITMHKKNPLFLIAKNYAP